MSTDFEIEVRGAFSLARAKSFLAEFAPLDGAGVVTTEERLTFAFLLDGTYAPVGVTVRQRDAGLVVGEALGSSASCRSITTEPNRNAWRSVTLLSAR